MLVKAIVITPSGSVEPYYANVQESPGGYADLFLLSNQLAKHGILLNHGDTIKVEFVEQLDADERTAEDERQLAAVR